MKNERLTRLREKAPLVHCITNHVTVNDCANILLACGASPVMADDIAEVEDIVSISQALVVNSGTLTARTSEAMILAGKKANAWGRPIVFDPVGAGASAFRTDFARRFLREVDVAVIRGNMSEIKTLAMSPSLSRGVDACAEDNVTEDRLDAAILFAKDFAKRVGAVVVITGAIDLVADAATAFVIRHGHPMMARVTGTGCQLTALIAAFVAANPDGVREAAATAVGMMGLAGEQAFARLGPLDGTATYRAYVIDAVSRMTNEELQGKMKYERR